MKEARSNEPVKRPQTSSGEFITIIAIILIWLTMVAFSKPVGNFPLNDDWSYGRAVKTLLQQGRPEIIDIVTMTLIAQVYWGALFCLPFGFSFTALRISTLTLGLVGVIATYLMLRELGTRKTTPLIGALVLATNPIYFALSNTFMTDVPFLSVTILALLAWTRVLKRPSVTTIAVATLLACIAILIRQTALALPIAFFISYIVKRGPRIRTLSVASLPAIATISVYLGYMKWLDAVQGIPQFYIEQNRWMLSFIKGGWPNMVSGLGSVALNCTIYLGWFLFPMLLMVPARNRREIIFTTAIGLLLTAGVFHAGRLMPLKGEPTGDIITKMGIGPLTLWDTFVLKQDSLTPIPLFVWVLVTAFGVIGGSILIHEVISSLYMLVRHSKRNNLQGYSTHALLLTTLVIALSPAVLMRTHGYFDRYFLPGVPLLAGYLMYHWYHSGSLRPSRLSTAIALLLLAISGFFSVALTHDYLAWNRARWTALEHMINKENVQPSDIDGGLEFNFWHNYDPFHWNAWGLVNDDYRIAFSPLEGHEVISTYSFSRWLPPERAEIFVLRKVY